MDKYDVNVLKTAFLYRSLHYVEWSGKDKNGSSDLNICLSGQSTFSRHISSLSGKSIKQREIVILDPLISGYKDCHVLYVYAANIGIIEQLKEKGIEKGILTVSDFNDSGGRGGILNLVLHGENIRLEINNTLAEKNDLKVSAKLLRVAKVIKDDNNE